jgi:phage terminase small subunit
MPKKEQIKLTDKQKAFCKFYIYDWNATQAAIKAGYSEKSAKEIASETLTKLNVQAYIKELQSRGEKLVNLSKQKVADEYKKIAFCSIAHLHDTWITRKEFEELTQDEKSCISEITTSVRKVKDEETIIDIEYVKIKLHDKVKALENLSKMYGYNDPERLDLSTKGESLNQITEIRIVKTTK